MTAGRGIMHAEMPRQNPDGSANVGLQLWVDLPAHLKACEPRYRDLRAAEIPHAELDGGKVHVRVISGRAGGGKVATLLNHRIAMSMTVAALAAAHPIAIDDVAPVGTSYPNFFPTLDALTTG